MTACAFIRKLAEKENQLGVLIEREVQSRLWRKQIVGAGWPGLNLARDRNPAVFAHTSIPLQPVSTRPISSDSHVFIADTTTAVAPTVSGFRCAKDTLTLQYVDLSPLSIAADTDLTRPRGRLTENDAITVRACWSQRQRSGSAIPAFHVFQPTTPPGQGRSPC